MKKLAIVFAFMFALVANTFAQADAAPAPLKDAKTSKVDRKAEKINKDDRKAKMKAGADDLGLTSDQKAKMKDIAQSFKGKMKAIKTDASLSRDQKKTQMGEVAKSHEAELKAVMTPEQFTKYSEMKKARQDNNREKRAQKQGQKQGKSRDKKGGADQDGDGQ